MPGYRPTTLPGEAVELAPGLAARSCCDARRTASGAVRIGGRGFGRCRRAHDETPLGLAEAQAGRANRRRFPRRRRRPHAGSRGRDRRPCPVRSPAAKLQIGVFGYASPPRAAKTPTTAPAMPYMTIATMPSRTTSPSAGPAAMVPCASVP